MQAGRAEEPTEPGADRALIYAIATIGAPADEAGVRAWVFLARRVAGTCPLDQLVRPLAGRPATPTVRVTFTAGSWSVGEEPQTRRRARSARAESLPPVVDRGHEQELVAPPTSARGIARRGRAAAEGGGDQAEHPVADVVAVALR